MDNPASHPLGAAITIVANYLLSIAIPHVATIAAPPVEVVQAEQMLVSFVLAWLMSKSVIPPVETVQVKA